MQSALVLGGIAIAAPLLYALTLALKAPDEYLVNPHGLPHHLTGANFTELFRVLDVPVLMRNTFIVVALSSIGTVVSSALVAYPLARIRFRGRGFVTVLVLATMMLPPQVLLIPQYILFVKLGWVDTFLPLVVPTFFATSGFFVFLLRQAFRGIPKELDEAVLVDGGSYWTILRVVVLPLSRRPLLIVFILQVVATYNDYFAPVVYLHSPGRQTAAVGIPLAAQTASGVDNAPVIMAGALIFVLPLLLFFVIFQRWLVKGISLTGAVKG